MLDPKRIEVTREPLVVNGQITFVGTMIFNVRESIRAELFPPNDPPRQAQIIDQMERSLATKAHLAAYGDLIVPVLKLAGIARRAPSNYQHQAEVIIAELTRLLRVKLQPTPPEEPDPVKLDTKLKGA